MSDWQVYLQAEDLPASHHVSPTDGGRGAFGNNDKGRRIAANRARRAYRLVNADAHRTGSGLFVDEEWAHLYARAHGWQIVGYYQP